MRRIVDTNVVVRLITQDDPEQFQAARNMVEEGPVVVLTTVLLETAWVLKSAFRYSAERTQSSFESLFSLRNIVLEEGDRIRLAMLLHEEGLDLADAMHLAGAAGSGGFFTFDRALIRRAATSKIFPPDLVRLP